jgi:bile acid-coenzyme A ligase
MILRGGANIYPAEVEAAVMAHPQVRSCVAVGLPDPEFGQRVHAILELTGAADAQSVVDGMGGFLADQLSRYKHPESFEIVSVGPRDDSGKVRRTLLRDERAAWLKEGRAFRIMPSRESVKPVEQIGQARTIAGSISPSGVSGSDL